MADKKIALELEVNIKKGDMTLGELNSQLNEVKASLQEQQTALIAYQKELAKLEEQRNAILSKGTISSEEFNIQESLNAQIKTVNASIDTQKLSIKSLTAEQSTAANAVKSLTGESANYNKVIQGIDKLTGGAATEIKKLYEGFGEGIKAVKGFTTGLGGISKALIATGIGAFVVALGLVVAYWEEINDFIDGGNKKLQTQIDLNQEQLGKSEEELKLLELQEDILNEQGLSTKEIVKQKKESIEESKKLNQLALDKLKIQRDTLLAQLLEQNILEKAISTVSGARGFKFNAFTGSAADSFKEIEKSIQTAEEKALKFELTLAKIYSEEEKKSDKIKDKKQKDADKADAAAKKAAAKKAADKKIADAEELRLAKEKEKELEDIRLGKINTEAERRQEELDAVDRQYTELIKLAKKNKQNTKELEEAQQTKKDEIRKKNEQADIDAEKAKNDKILKEQEDLIKDLEYKQKLDENDFSKRRAEIARRQVILAADTKLSDDQKLIIAKQFTDELIEISKEETEQRKELNKQLVDASLNTLNSLVSYVQASSKAEEDRLSFILSNTEKGSQAQIDAEKALEKQKEKSFKLNQQEAIGRTIIDTAQGAIKAYTSQIIPGDPTSIIRGALAAAAITASGALQIASIRKQKFYGAGNGGITSTTSPTLGSGGAGTAPIGFTQNLNNTQIPTTKVIVTETDIRRATRNIDGIYNKAVVVE